MFESQRKPSQPNQRMSSLQNSTPSVLAFPMHGQQKLLSEGYRTRDGHMIEWLGKLNSSTGPVAVLSRPEPQLLRPLTRKILRMPPAANTVAFDSYSWAIPKFKDRRAWWLQSKNDYTLPNAGVNTPAVVWNPLLTLSNIWNELQSGKRKISVDLLDDWSIHYAFESIWPELEIAYRRIFDRADSVTANAEGTLALAHRFGRHDATLLTNGCDPDRFDPASTASGPITVGYVGKIGKRVNLELVREAAEKLPEVTFVFAGPILDSEYKPVMENLPNLRLLGDVHYKDVPALLQSFDIGWVPHNVGEFEVGGDVLKTYEYRAAGLPVLSTPVAGAGQRDLGSVYVRPAEEHVAWIETKVGSQKRLPREPGNIPEVHTWRHKTEFVLSELTR